MPSIILTRTADDNSAIAYLFEKRGCAVYSVPMIELRPLPKDMCGLRSVRRLAGGEPVLITSEYAAELWLDLRETDFSEHSPDAYYVVGQRSAALLRESDPDVPIREVARSGEDLLERDLEGVERVLYPCSTGRRDGLVDGLKQKGIDVIELPLYSPVPPSGNSERLRDVLADAAVPLAIAFFSPSAVDNFFALSPALPHPVIFGAIGATTAAALAGHGVADCLLPAEPTAEALAEVILVAIGL